MEESSTKFTGDQQEAIQESKEERRTTVEPEIRSLLPFESICKDVTSESSVDPEPVVTRMSGTVKSLEPSCCGTVILDSQPESQHPGLRPLGTSDGNRSLVEVPRVKMNKALFSCWGMEETEELEIVGFHDGYVEYRKWSRPRHSTSLGFWPGSTERVMDVVQLCEPESLFQDWWRLVESDQWIAELE